MLACARQHDTPHNRCSDQRPVSRAQRCGKMRSRSGISSAFPIGSGKHFQDGRRRWPEARPRSHGNPGSRPRRGVSTCWAVAIRDSRSSESASERAQRLSASNPDTSGGRSHTQGRTFENAMGCSTWVRFRDNRCRRPEVAYESLPDRRAPSRSRRDSRRSPHGLRSTDGSESRVADRCGKHCRCSVRARVRSRFVSSPDSSGDSSHIRAERPACGRSSAAAVRSGDRLGMMPEAACGVWRGRLRSSW